jgi:hypothetical protein
MYASTLPSGIFHLRTGKCLEKFTISFKKNKVLSAKSLRKPTLEST